MLCLETVGKGDQGGIGAFVAIVLVRLEWKPPHGATICYYAHSSCEFCALIYTEYKEIKPLGKR